METGALVAGRWGRMVSVDGCACVRPSALYAAEDIADRLVLLYRETGRDEAAEVARIDRAPVLDSTAASAGRSGGHRLKHVSGGRWQVVG